MARQRNRRNKTDKRAKERRKEKALAEDVATVVEDTASRFTCTTAVAKDFADQCEQRIEDMEFDLVCTKLALEMWAPPTLRNCAPNSRAATRRLGGARTSSTGAHGAR